MAKKAITLSPEHQALAERINFDPRVLDTALQWISVDVLRQLTVERTDAKGFPVQEPAEGFCFDNDRFRIEYLATELRGKFEHKGYLFFLTRVGDAETPATLAAIRGTDPYDMLRFMGTEDVNGNQTIENIIKTLKKWQKQFPFRVVGANRDWVEGRFRKNPPDMIAFAKEVIKIAPDSYGQGNYESVKDFAEDMRKARSFHLWGD